MGLGSGLAWTSPVLPHIQEGCTDHCTFGNETLTNSEASWVSGLYPIGALLGCLICGLLMDLIGRKWTLVAMTMPSITGWILLTLSGAVPLTSAWWLYVGRLLTGIGGGTFSFLGPIYTMETCQASMRGALGSVTSLFLVIGILFTNGIGALASWQLLTGSCLLSPGK